MVRKYKWILIGLVVILLGWRLGTRFLTHSISDSTESQIQRAKKVRILRDEFGVPHIFAKTNADVAFGLAYAHAQDDFPTTEKILAATRGKLALYELSKSAVENDFYVQLFQPNEVAARNYGKLSPEVRAVLEGYADGLNYYVSQHKGEADARFYPYTAQDIVAGFVHKIPLFRGVQYEIRDAMEEEEKEGATALSEFPQQAFISFPGISHFDDLAMDLGFLLGGSNSHAVAAHRSADGITRLNINSHQPFDGPVAWYEAHLVSEEGWNMIGGLFPGAPFILHGHNQNLGWAHTVNAPDIIDTYKLETDSKFERYKMDGEWKPLIKRDFKIQIDLILFTLSVTQSVYDAPQGPAIKTDTGIYAIRMSNFENLPLASEQWFRMNLARNFDEWKNAMRINAIPMFNTMYADSRNIYYVYNAAFPKRKDDPTLDWGHFLPGNRSDAIPTEVLPFDSLPMVTNPPSGFLQNCNSDPFQTTVGVGNPNPNLFAKNLGIEHRMTNRAYRSLELFGADPSITREEFWRYKFDRSYSRKAPIFEEAINPLIANFKPKTKDEIKGIEMLKNWDGKANLGNRTAMLAVNTWNPTWFADVVDHKHPRDWPSIEDNFREAISDLKKIHGSIDPPIEEVQVLKRGKFKLPVASSNDTMNSITSKKQGNAFVGLAGDSYILLVEFTPKSTESWSINQFGSSARPSSPHYFDQAPFYQKRTLRRTLLSEVEVRERMESEYSPGFEKIPKRSILGFALIAIAVFVGAYAIYSFVSHRRGKLRAEK